MLKNLTQYSIVKNSPLGSLDVIAILAVILAPLLLLSVKGWLNAWLALLILLSLWHLLIRPSFLKNLKNLGGWDWALLLSFLTPIMAIFITQWIRGDWNDNPYDAPARIFLSAAVFFYLRYLGVHWTQPLALVAPLSLMIVLAVIFSFPEISQSWGDRYATYFVDPLTLGQYALLFGFICLFSINHDEIHVLKAYKILGFFLGLLIAFGSASRSAWLALPVLLGVFVVMQMRNKKIYSPFALLVIFLALAAIGYFYSDILYQRIDQVLKEYALYFSGENRDTSFGLRVSFIRAAWYLWLQSPWVGYGDAQTPNLMLIPEIAHFSSPMLEYGIKHNGVHNELMQNMLRSGIFGFIAYFCQIFIPIGLFIQSIRRPEPEVRVAGQIGLIYMTSIFIFGLTTETFNLKFTAGFYGLTIAALAAQCLSYRRDENNSLKC